MHVTLKIYVNVLRSEIIIFFFVLKYEDHQIDEEVFVNCWLIRLYMYYLNKFKLYFFLLVDEKIFRNGLQTSLFFYTKNKKN